MDSIEQLEYPLPVISADVASLELECSGSCKGSFTIKNKGGSELEGNIRSNSSALSFSPARFRGNSSEIGYTVSANAYKAGDVIRTTALIQSNGGEIQLPVTIRITPPAIIARDGTEIATMHDFAAYANSNPVGARQLFVQHDFMLWLFENRYPHIELYESFAKDPNKERAVDNFLIVGGFKRPAELCFVKPLLDLHVAPSQPATGGIEVLLGGDGYVDAAVLVYEGERWFKMDKLRFSAADFKNNRLELDYLIIPELMEGRFAQAKLSLVANGSEVDTMRVRATKAELFDIALDRFTYDYEDSGTLNITNNSGADLMLEISVSDPSIHFGGARYLISETARIDFEIKVSKLAQLAMGKRPVIEAYINVSSALKDGSSCIKSAGLDIGSY